MHDLVKLANIIVRAAFKDKTDNAGKPYIIHLTTVANNARIYMAYGETLADEDIECVGLLHDLLEDCPDWTEGALRTLFTEKIVDAVVVLTKNPEGEDYKEYILRVAANPLARVVKLSDLRHNMDITRQGSFNDVNVARLKKYHQAYTTLRNIK